MNVASLALICCFACTGHARRTQLQMKSSPYESVGVSAGAGVAQHAQPAITNLKEFLLALNAPSSSHVPTSVYASSQAPVLHGNRGRSSNSLHYANSRAKLAGHANIHMQDKGASIARKRVVVLGSGWGAISFVKSLGKDSPYDVTLVSPRNFFLYTPLLPGAATGAVEDRSIVEPIRKAIADKGYQYFEAEAVNVDSTRKTVLCRGADHSFDRGETKETFELEYDYLITAVGAVPNTFGVPGVAEHCLFFKEIEDAARFRREVNERFERAALPGVSAERSKELLSFVIVGAGPTGVELAAELYDMVYEDVAKTFPKRLLADVKIRIIDLQEKVLSTYDRRIAEYATEFFKRGNIECMLNTTVKEVKDRVLVVADRSTGVESEVPFGLAVWASGIKLNALCEKIIDDLPAGSQENRRSLITDKGLRVKGSGGSIFALGDCATVERPRSLAKAEELFKEAAGCVENGECTVELDRDAVRAALMKGAEEFKHLEALAKDADDDEFFKFTNGEPMMTLPQFRAMLEDEDKSLRSFPATAQVAKQQGEYLAQFFNDCNGDEAALNSELSEFAYFHKGSLAYIGKDSAVADIPGVAIVKGVAAGLIWKSFETVSQVSPRNIFLVASDMIRTKIFGRDISRIN